MTGGSYFQLMIKSETNHAHILASTGITGTPFIPSVILTVQQIMYTQVDPTGSLYSNYAYWNPNSSSWLAETGTTVHIGGNAGLYSQQGGAVAIGSDSGKFSQGQSSIAIGNLAGNSNQSGNSIILNASGTILNGADSAFYVNPTRSLAAGTGTNQLTYNTSTSEIYLNTDKTFVIDHPQYKDKYLVHACLEGPESGVYYRGKGRIDSNLDDETEIILPEYVKDLATDFTIQITSIGKESSLYKTSEVNQENGTFKVFGKSGKFFWHVYGKRQSIQVEPLKSAVDIKGSGPYKWI